MSFRTVHFCCTVCYLPQLPDHYVLKYDLYVTQLNTTYVMQLRRYTHTHHIKYELDIIIKQTIVDQCFFIAIKVVQ